MQPMSLTILTAIAALASLPACTPTTDNLTGKVMGVSDGDTIKVLVDRKQATVRLKVIDAPKAKQSFGIKSKQALKAKACRWYFSAHPFFCPSRPHTLCV
jgi:endonuclease YncB( thermonuclease family)